MNKLVKFIDVKGNTFAVSHDDVILTEAAFAEQGNTIIHARGQAFYVNESIDDVLGILVGEKPKAKKDEPKVGDYPTDEQAKANAQARKDAEAKAEEARKEAAAKDKADAHKSHAKAHA